MERGKTMKQEWRKQEKVFYLPKNVPEVVTLPKQQFIMIKGAGDPNQEDFSQRVGVLYSLAYPLKMRFKKRCQEQPELAKQFEFDDYTVYPLEGVWSSSNPADPHNKDFFTYTIMIRQPEMITEADFAEALAATQIKKPHPLLEEVTFGEITEGLCVQMLHVGRFDDEPASFAKMQAFADEAGLIRQGWHHREIYLSDPRKTAPEKSRTVLRFEVATK